MKQAENTDEKAVAWERQKHMEQLLLTAAIQKEKLSTGEDIYVALCLELDIPLRGEALKTTLGFIGA